MLFTEAFFQGEHTCLVLASFNIAFLHCFAFSVSSQVSFLKCEHPLQECFSPLQSRPQGFGFSRIGSPLKSNTTGLRFRRGCFICSVFHANRRDRVSQSKLIFSSPFPYAFLPIRIPVTVPIRPVTAAKTSAFQTRMKAMCAISNAVRQRVMRTANFTR